MATHSTFIKSYHKDESFGTKHRTTSLTQHLFFVRVRRVELDWFGLFLVVVLIAINKFRKKRRNIHIYI